MIKVYKKGDNFYFLRVRSEFVYYKIKNPCDFDLYGNLKTHTEKLKPVLILQDYLNNQVLSKMWRINGWKSAGAYLESLGYTFKVDLSFENMFLMDAEQQENLRRFINKESMQDLKPLHDYKVGEIYTLNDKEDSTPLYKIKSVSRRYIQLEHIQYGFIDNFEYGKFHSLVKLKLKKLK